MYSAAICLHLSRYDLPDISMELLKEAITLATHAGQGRGTAHGICGMARSGALPGSVLAPHAAGDDFSCLAEHL